MRSPALADELAATVLELARVPAPTFAEEPRLAWLERRLRGQPGSVGRDAVGNVVWRWGAGRPRLLLLAHVDTVFGPDVELDCRRDDGVLRGPGVGDNAAAVVVTLRVLCDLHAGGDLAPGAVAFTVGEEGLGDLRGARAACASLRPELAVAVEGQGLEVVEVDAVGSVRYRVCVRGPGGHSWEDRGRPSAVHALLELGARLLPSSAPDAPVNIGLISGGRSVNTVADAAELVVERRSLVERDLDAFVDAVAALALEPPLVLERQLVGRRPAGRLARDHPLLATVRAVRAELALPDALGQASTDANAALALGIPALTVGCSIGGELHTPREHIDVASLALGYAQLRAVVTRLLQRHG